MTYEEILDLPARRLHMAIITEEVIVKLYKENDPKADARITMALMNAICAHERICSLIGPIVVESATGTVIDGRNILVALHGFLLATGARNVPASFLLI